MAYFEILRWDGQIHETVGLLEAADKAEALSTLRQSGLRVDMDQQPFFTVHGQRAHSAVWGSPRFGGGWETPDAYRETVRNWNDKPESSRLTRRADYPVLDRVALSRLI